jgi:hypothetical protein
MPLPVALPDSYLTDPTLARMLDVSRNRRVRPIGDLRRRGTPAREQPSYWAQTLPYREIKTSEDVLNLLGLGKPVIVRGGGRPVSNKPSLRHGTIVTAPAPTLDQNRRPKKPRCRSMANALQDVTLLGARL